MKESVSVENQKLDELTVNDSNDATADKVVSIDAESTPIKPVLENEEIVDLYSKINAKMKMVVHRSEHDK